MKRLNLHKIDNFTFLSFAIANAIISIITVSFTNYHHLTMVRGVQTIIFSFSALLAYLALANKMTNRRKLITLVFYLFAFIGLWFNFSISHPMVVIYLLSLLILAILTMRKTLRYLALTLITLLTGVCIYTDLFLRGPVALRHENQVQYVIIVIAIGLGILVTSIINRVALERTLDQLTEESLLDGLTGALNKRAFILALERLDDRFIRYHENYAIVYIDIDKFKTINDDFGHEVGDCVLRESVDYFKKHIRKSDGIYRVGGDEFVITMSNIDQIGSLSLVKRLLKQHQFVCSREITIDFSYGIADKISSTIYETDLVKLADQKMYENKRLKTLEVEYKEELKAKKNP